MDFNSSRNRSRFLILKENMEKEAKTTGDFVAPGRNAI